MSKEQILEKTFGSLSKKGNEYLTYCPSCKHSKRKLSININKNKFKCWVCDLKGNDISHLLKKFSTNSLYNQWKELAGEINLAEIKEINQERYEKVELPAEYKNLDNKIKYKSPKRIQALKYLMKERGLEEKDIWRWQIGFCEEGKYSDRLIIPSFDKEGSINYFVARAFNRIPWPPYDNPKAKKNEIIFNELYIDYDDDLILVEGVFDAIKAGYNAIPLLGSTLPEDSKLFNEIVKNNSTVYLGLDKDAKDKQFKIERLLSLYGIETYKIPLGKFSDIGEMNKRQFSLAKNNAKRIKNSMREILERSINV